MEPFGAIRLLVEPHAVIEGFFYSVNRNIIFHEKNTGVGLLCNSVIVA